MKTNIYSALIFTLCIGVNVLSQQLPLGSQYYVNMYSFNPAEVGTSSLQSFFSHRNQFAGITGGPQTTYLSVDGPTKYDKIGLGFMAMSDRTDILSKNTFVVSYSYKLKFGQNHGLNFGLNLGILNNSISFDEAIIIDQDDPLVSNSSRSKTGFTSDFGLLYKIKELQIGVSVPQIFSNSNLYINTLGEKFSFTSSRHYRASLKYTFFLNESKNLSIYPLLAARFVNGAPFQYDANVVVDFKKIGWIGMTYHSNYAFSSSVGLRYQNMIIGYVYDYPIGNLNQFTKGSHEFILGYRFGDQNKKEEFNYSEANKKINQLQLIQNKHEKLIDSLIKTNDQIYLDAMNQKNIIDSLIENLTKRGESTNNNKVETIRTGIASEFSSEDGTEIQKGYYVVVGSFAVKEFAKRFKNGLLNEGYEQVKSIQRKESDIVNVYLYYTKDINEAINEKRKYTNIDENVWVLRID
jgi:type IX secretion system PorP/SprF family membrane protein